MIKWTFKLLFITTLITLFSCIAYLSIIWDKTETLLVRSPIQGVKILPPKTIGFYPERILPGFVKATPIPESIKLNGTLTVSLPYADLLLSIDNFTITLNYDIDYAFEEKDIQSFIKDPAFSKQDYWKARVENILLNELQLAIQGVAVLPMANVRENLIKALFPQKKANISFSHYPNMEQYKKIKAQMNQEGSQEKMVTTSIMSSFKTVEEKQKLELKKEQMEQSLDFALSKAKQITEAKTDQKITLSLLEYLLGENLSPKESK